MKIIVMRSPKLFAPLLRRMFRINEEVNFPGRRSPAGFFRELFALCIDFFRREWYNIVRKR